MTKLLQKRFGNVRAMTVVLFLCFSSYFFYPLFVSKTFGSNINPMPTPRPKPTTGATKPGRKIKYSEFPHDAKAHAMACGSCHKFPTANWKQVRNADAAFPDVTDYPKHESCLNCHRRQFFGSSKPVICAICHTNPSPRDSSRHPFPNPREIFDTTAKGKKAESDFVVGFPHDKHVDIVSKNEARKDGFVNVAWTRSRNTLRAEESCSVCHKTFQPQGQSPDEYVTNPPEKLGDLFWLKKGTFKTTPIGHTTCFTCHSADSGVIPAPETCSACHKLKALEPPADFDATFASSMGIDDKITLASWRRRDSSGKFQHEFFGHVDSSCSTCHNVATMKTDVPMTKKVGISSCATCHATATSDEGGAINFEVDSRKANAAFQCVKCHVAFGKLPVPQSHLKAVSAPGGK